MWTLWFEHSIVKSIFSRYVSLFSVYREIFNFFDHEKKKYLIAEDFEHALRMMKQNPSPEEVQDLLQTYDVNGKIRLHQSSSCAILLRMVIVTLHVIDAKFIWGHIVIWLKYSSSLLFTSRYKIVFITTLILPQNLT